MPLLNGRVRVPIFQSQPFEVRIFVRYEKPQRRPYRVTLEGELVRTGQIQKRIVFVNHRLHCITVVLHPQDLVGYAKLHAHLKSFFSNTSVFSFP